MSASSRVGPAISPYHPRVLLVDDQPIVGKAMGDMLAAHSDIAFQFCPQPREALVVAGQFQPTVILQDLVMPDIDGLTLIRHFRANPSTREVPLIMLSSREDPTVKAEAFALGANDYLVKLPAAAELIARIRYHSQAYQNLRQKNHAQQQLETAIDHISTLNRKLQSENSRMLAELDIARQLQQLILPRAGELSAIAGLDIACAMEPADEVGGDYYDILVENDQVFIAIGDVTGHGLHSGAFAMMMQMAIRALLAAEVHEPERFFSALNHALHANARRMKSDKNTSLALLRYHDGVLTVSGQHEEVIVLRANGEVECLPTVDLGFPVGFIDDIADYVHQARTELHPGDGIVLYSDGITEMESASHEEFGLPRLVQVLRDHHGACAAELRDAVLAAARAHGHGQRTADDCTLVVIRRH